MVHVQTDDIEHLESAPADPLRCESPIDVIYIAGYGRSGSTLLDLMLGGVVGFESLGEMKYIWERGCLENHLCATGQAFWDCTMWSDVIQAVAGRRDSKQLDAWRHCQRRVDSVPRMPGYFGRDGSIAHGQAEYIAVLSRLYRAIRDRLGAAVLIDSSKHPSYALLLTHVPGIRLHVVHLVRDCRAVANSWRRKRIRPEIHWARRYMPRYSVTRTAIKWRMHNRLAERLEPHADHYLMLRYEDLADAPADSLKRIVRRFELASPSTDRAIACLQQTPVVQSCGSYSVSGNPLRFQPGELPIVCDHGWKRELPRRAAWLADLIARPLQRKYGYLSPSKQDSGADACVPQTASADHEAAATRQP